MNIARLRKQKGWAQQDLADLIGVEQPTISRIERGSDSVTLRLLIDIARALEVPLYELFLDDHEGPEVKILQVYRNLSEDRKKGWQDMAHAVVAGSPTDD